MRAIGDQLERHARDRAPFAVLLAEIVEPGEAGEIGQLAGAVEELLEMELGIAAGSHHGDRGAALTRERPGRYWLLVPGVDRRAAETLAERLRRLARGLGTSTPGGVELALGTSSCPQDGTEPAALAAHADVGLYAARSALRRARPGGGFERRR
jgi:GGDEF domain-containing protein